MKYTPAVVFSVKFLGTLLFLGLPLFGQATQTLYIPQFVDGGGWQSTIVITNTSAVTATATLTFHSDSGGGNTQAWTPSFLETSSTSGLVLASGSSMFLHTPGTAPTLTQGWGEVDAGAGIVAYNIFTNRLPGQKDQDSTAPAVSATNRILVPYDDANGFVSAIAVVNPTATAQTVSIGFQTTDGIIAMDLLPIVPPMGHLAFVLSQQFPYILGHRGLAEFYSATGNLSMIALRFNPTQSSTSMPVFFETGTPLIQPPPVTDPYPSNGYYNAVRPDSSVK
ncbi:MAG: hypothetical protein M3O20_10075 [Acidobacteriota bacterium]|nr:hypothetical protein [Acidobacteriota bacterium]